jgi:hypothetical protein
LVTSADDLVDSRSNFALDSDVLLPELGTYTDVVTVGMEPVSEVFILAGVSDCARVDVMRLVEQGTALRNKRVG